MDIDTEDIFQPYVTPGGQVYFVVEEDGAPKTYTVYAYADNGGSYSSLWTYDVGTSGGDFAFGPGATIYVWGLTGLADTIYCLSDGDRGDPHGAGMGYTDNQPPAVPSGPSPINGASNLTTPVVLSWTCSDPDAHSLKYDVLVASVETGEEGRFVPVTNDLVGTSVSITGLHSGIQYLWTVVAHDGQAESQGPIWSFSTESDADSDTDGDGIPDWWEFKYSGNITNMEAHDHADADGVDNYAEWVADSNPTNTLDYFRITTSRVETAGCVLHWSSSSNRVYDIHFSTNLLLVPSFSILRHDLPGVAPINVYTNTVHEFERQNFYRIAVKLEPSSWQQNPVNGYWYRLSELTGTWSEVESEALATGGHLATIRSAEENEWILNTFDPASVNFWIGLRQQEGSPEPSGGWEWVSGEPLMFTNWGSGEPNDNNGNEDFCEFKGIRSSFPGRWNDQSGENVLPGLIEKSGD